MNRETLTEILRIKSALLDRQCHTLAEVNQRRNAAEAEVEALEAAASGAAPAGEDFAEMQAMIRWQAAQRERAIRARAHLQDMADEIKAAETAVKEALGEKRAIERLVKDPTLLAS